jgi:hypothetical protein
MIKTVEIRTCDLPHDKPRTNADTVTFALDSSGYQIELCPKDRAALEKIMADYVEHARKTPVNGMAKKSSATRTVTERRRSRDIRAWAERNGKPVSGRGRIPAEIITEYDAAH